MQRLSARGAVTRLSVAALQCAGALDTNDVETLAEYLYRYPDIPLTRAWRDRLVDSRAVEQWITPAPGGPGRAHLDGHWIRLPDTTTPGWLTWVRRSRDPLEAAGPEYKLYASPACEEIRRTFAALIELLAYCRASSIKIGADAAGLARPDKIVAYFDDLGDLALAARELEHRLEGLTADGVPFTAEISHSGLLSWGIDPPGRGALSQDAQSWRHWVTLRLAANLIAARRDSAGPREPWRAALDSLSKEGIDVHRWLPKPETLTRWSG